MNKKSELLELLLSKLKIARTDKKISTKFLEDLLIIGPGWIDCLEHGDADITLEILLSLMKEIDLTLLDLVSDLDVKNKQKFPRNIYATLEENGIAIRFKYSRFDAKYMLKGASISEFNIVLKELRDGLAKLNVENKNQAEALKTEAVVKSFIKAVNLWPKANPSDIWWFIIYRAYCDPYNHPAQYARLDFDQSWKRAGGWALEEILVRHYKEALQSNGIRIFIAQGKERVRLLAQAKVANKLEADKADVLLTGKINNQEVLFGVVHVKASFAERRTDDVPMSKILIDSGYISPLWTFDCKSKPSEIPFNKGELGSAHSEINKHRSAKRKDIEDDGYFSACFSYNQNTIPTPLKQSSKARIFTCNFNNANGDEFFNFVIKSWHQFLLRYNGNIS